MLMKIKIVLILTVSLWGFSSAFLNIIDWDGTLSAVNAATSMSTLEEGESKFQAISNPIVTWIGSIFVLLSKLTTGIMCLLGSANMWRARTNSMRFEAAKQLAITGCAVSMLMLFLGFVVIAEGWFELWRSDSMRGPVLESAFRYAGMIGIIAIFVSMKDKI